jgi:hypothetical protein
MNDEERAKAIDEYRARLKSIEVESPYEVGFY